MALDLFQHAQSHYPLYKAMVGKHSWDMIQQYAQKFLFSLIRDHLKPKGSARKKTPVPLDIAAHFIVSSFLALLTWWLEHNMPHTAEQMTEMFKGLTKPGLMPDSALKREFALGRRLEGKPSGTTSSSAINWLFTHRRIHSMPPRPILF